MRDFNKITIGFCLLMGISLLLTFLPAALNGHWLGIVVSMLGCFEIGWSVCAIATFRRPHAPRRQPTAPKDRIV